MPNCGRYTEKCTKERDIQITNRQKSTNTWHIGLHNGNGWNRLRPLWHIFGYIYASKIMKGIFLRSNSFSRPRRLFLNHVILHLLSSLDQLVQEFKVLDLFAPAFSFLSRVCGATFVLVLLPRVRTLGHVVEETKGRWKRGARGDEFSLGIELHSHSMNRKCFKLKLTR